jgi:integrase
MCHGDDLHRWWVTCPSDSDGVTRIIERRGPADEHDKHGKLAEDCLIEALAERRPPCGADALNLDTLVMSLVDQHLVRLAEDGRSPATIDTYMVVVRKMVKFLSGVRVREASPARLDAALRSMRSAHGANMARHAKTVLRGALALAVMANVLGANPIRDVASIKSNRATKGATALTGDQLRELLARLRTSDYCSDHDLVDPITVLIATGLRRSELLGLRWCDFDTDAGTITITGKVIREAGKGLIRMEETKTASGRRTPRCPGSRSRR